MSELLEVNHVSYAYHSIDGETETLADISFHIKEGEFAAIVGPSGCGKSTLLQLMTKNLKPAFFYQPYIKSSADQNFAFSVLQSFSYLMFFFTCQTAVQSHVRQKLPARRSHTGKRQHRLPICRQAPA